MSDNNIHDLAFEDGELKQKLHVRGMCENWFLDYASYVILMSTRS